MCSESLIPPHSYQYLQEVGIYTDHRKRCSDMVEASYYSHNSGPLICHTCCSVLSPEDQIKYKRLKNDNKSVIPCSGSLDCMRSAPRYPDGWVLKPKQNRKKGVHQVQVIRGDPRNRAHKSENFNFNFSFCIQV